MDDTLYIGLILLIIAVAFGLMRFLWKRANEKRRSHRKDRERYIGTKLKKKAQVPDIEVYDPVKAAGKRGEIEGSQIIMQAMEAGDYLLRNVSITYDERPAEMDNIVINKYGVFIIEVKNYKGRLYGKEDDFKWIKLKDDGYGNTFQKAAQNPIPQVKRQIHILAKYLESCGFYVWVEGYAFFVNHNCPVKSEHVLSDVEEIKNVLHTFNRNRLSRSQVEQIKKILS